MSRGITGGRLLSSAARKMFLTVTRLYFSAEEGGERSVCLAFAFLFLLLAMLVQVVPEEILELGLEPGTCIRAWGGVDTGHSLLWADECGFKWLDPPACCSRRGLLGPDSVHGFLTPMVPPWALGIRRLWL